MPQKDIQAGPHIKFVDEFLSSTILRFIPYSIPPNSVTIVRFICVPIVIILLLLQNYTWGAAVFVVGILTDALDGAMARTRNQITPWGKIADPLADKLLIGTTALILVTRYVGPWIAIILVCIELLLAARAAYMYTHNRNTGANSMGKIKMVLQSIALAVLFAYILWGTSIFLTIATFGLYVAIFFALMSLLIAPSV